MNRPCTCNRCSLDLGSPYQPGECRLCWLFHHDPAYRQLWNGKRRADPSKPRVEKGVPP